VAPEIAGFVRLWLFLVGLLPLKSRFYTTRPTALYALKIRIQDGCDSNWDVTARSTQITYSVRTPRRARITVTITYVTFVRVSSAVLVNDFGGRSSSPNTISAVFSAAPCIAKTTPPRSNIWRGTNYPERNIHVFGEILRRLEGIGKRNAIGEQRLDGIAAAQVIDKFAEKRRRFSFMFPTISSWTQYHK